MREMYASIMMRFSPILKYQLAIDIHVISTVVAAAAGAAQRIDGSKASRVTDFLIMVSPSDVQFRGRSSSGQERHSGEPPQLVEGKPLDQAARRQPTPRDVDYSKVRVDALHHADAGERIAAFRDDFRFAALGEMLHHHPHVLRADGEVHRAAYRRDRVAAAVPVGE